MPPRRPKSVPAIRVNQWLPEWDEMTYSAGEYRRRPADHFFLFSMPAADLKALTGIHRRKATEGRARKHDLGIQRRHDEHRSAEIAEYIHHGFPWSALSAERKESGEFDDLKKPGWLPTALVLNVVAPGDTVDGQAVHQGDLLEFKEVAGRTELVLPTGFTGNRWTPKGAHPLTVIDGQHRLWAFDEAQAPGYELPVVAFVGLDVSWQAYLFYTINIKPKKINTSLAYDLYPLLRTADWLEKFEGHSVYRESRAQQLTEVMWSYTDSPWRSRINMLGEPGARGVSQASWIRSLMSTLIKASEGKGVRIGGLYGAPVGSDHLELPWNRVQQAAFLLHAWMTLSESITESVEEWAEQLRALSPDVEPDPAFAGRYSLLNTDQGVRGYLSVVNDLCVIAFDDLRLREWTSPALTDDGISDAAIDQALEDLRRRKVGRFVTDIASTLAEFDWRTSGTPGMAEQIRRDKARFRGGTGYKEIRIELLQFLTDSTAELVADTAADVLEQVEG